MTDANIFNGIKYGDKFLTRDGRIATYSHKEREGRWFILSNGAQFLVQTEYGNCLTNDIYQLDIVSRYHEPIDEEKLDRIATDYCKKELSHSYNESDAHTQCCKADFKAGYRKAKEE